MGDVGYLGLLPFLLLINLDQQIARYVSWLITALVAHRYMKKILASERRWQLMMTTTTITSPAVEALTGLQGYRFLNLTTFRKNSVPVVTTVLFALANDKIYVWTTKDSGKV